MIYVASEPKFILPREPLIVNSALNLELVYPLSTVINPKVTCNFGRDYEPTNGLL